MIGQYLSFHRFKIGQLGRSLSVDGSYSYSSHRSELARREFTLLAILSGIRSSMSG
jgi:hypothetical protein